MACEPREKLDSNDLVASRPGTRPDRDGRSSSTARLASRSEGDPIVTAAAAAAAASASVLTEVLASDSRLDDPFEEGAAAAADMLATAFDLAALDLPLALPAALVFISLQLSPACANDGECNMRAKDLMKDRRSKRRKISRWGDGTQSDLSYSGTDGWMEEYEYVCNVFREK